MNQEQIGKFIAEARKKANLTQQELASKLRITDRAVSKWENGRSMPDISLLKDLANILNVSVNDILSGEKSESDDSPKAIENTLSYGAKFTKEKIRQLFKNGAIIYTVLSLLAIIITLICNYSIEGTVSWSIVSNSSIIFAWMVIFIFMISKEKRMRNALIILTIGTIPFIYLLSEYFSSEMAFQIATPISIYFIIYFWLTYMTFKKMVNQKLLATSIIILLTIPLTIITNITLDYLIMGSSFFDFWDILSICLELFTAIIIWFYNNNQKKKKNS